MDILHEGNGSILALIEFRYPHHCWVRKKVCFLFVNRFIQHLSPHDYLFLWIKVKEIMAKVVKELGNKLDKSSMRH